MAKKRLRQGPPIKGEVTMNPAEVGDTPTSQDMVQMAKDAIEGVVMTPEDEEILKAVRRRDFGVSLAVKRKKWVDAKTASGVERRWVEDQDQYEGLDEASKRVASMMESAREGFPVMQANARKPTKSSVIVNITKTKTNAAVARLADMLLPTDDQNWGIRPTPVPSLVKALENGEPSLDEQGQPIPIPVQDAQGNGQMGPDGQPVMQAMTKGQHARMIMDEASKACTLMELEIADQLTECNHNTEARQAIHQAGVLGTGILKGPIVSNRVRRAWTKIGSAYTMEVQAETKPLSEYVSCWNVYPDPSCGNNIHNGSGIFEMRVLTEKQVRELVKQPGYIKEAIKEVLEEGPNTESLTEHEEAQRQRMGLTSLEKNYHAWEYWGMFDPEDLMAAGVDVGDTIEPINGCVIFINQTIVKAFINPLESGELPYDFYPWEQVDGQPWGCGVPRMMRTPQRVLNASWRQAMDNAGLAVGPQIVVKPSQIQPADKQWAITGRKIWYCNDENVDVRQAFTVFEFNMHLQELEGLIQLAMKFADEETSVPMLAQGEKGNAPDTVGGMTILMNSSNVVLRRLAKQFDDCITRPHITRYYEWNMLFNDKDEIKGDFSVDARGATALLVKDAQTQALIQLGQFMNNPVITPMVNWDQWFRETLKANHIDAVKILKTQDEIDQAQQAAQSQPQQPPPIISAAQIRAEGMVKVAGIRAQAQTAVAETQAQKELRIASDKIAYQQALAQQAAQDNARALQQQQQIELAQQEFAADQAERDRNNDIIVAQINERLQSAELLSVERQVLEKIKSQLAVKTMELTTQKQLAASDNLVKAHEVGGLPPPVQLPGRAPNGRAFTQV